MSGPFLGGTDEQDVVAFKKDEFDPAQAGETEQFFGNRFLRRLLREELIEFAGDGLQRDTTRRLSLEGVRDPDRGEVVRFPLAEVADDSFGVDDDAAAPLAAHSSLTT